ncbi:hypothetical protein AJ80_07222 [Polytolypa hystricis UAMH7299]|uniref:ML-like domain-containing protein n=1 Tax=Polytolypa hystricis (strain UAMH7299) TaxID=1447883 RepID=A0A2B7XRV0_POLH7|nr:hypothetical protein AJ80_07222 [Polytolypa hystricis UAMH7299]
MRIQSLPSLGLVLSLFSTGVLAGDILKNNGFASCQAAADIRVEKVNLSFDRDANLIIFDAAGSSSKSQKVKASLVINAYGQEFTQEFDPCDDKTKVDQLCPVPAGNFAAKGEQKISSEFADMIPSIAFSIPDLEAEATLKLIAKDGGQQLACIKSTVGNGKSLVAPAVSYVAAGVAGAALVVTGLAAVAAGGNAGVATSSPTFSEVLGWFQSMATNGMLSVNYPPVYRSFAKNFGFSSGLIPWDQMQVSIDNFRNMTGGNLTQANVEFLRKATLVFQDNSNSSNAKRSLASSIFGSMNILARDIETSVNSTSSEEGNEEDSVNHFVKGIQSFVEQLSIPEANTFMTVLLVFAIIVAGIAAGILLLKAILELWALYGSFPAKLTNFRKHYWGLLARTITSLILALYGIWTLYCVFQFTRGDSWAAKVLAGVTLAIFTGILAFFSFKIWRVARRYKKLEGDAVALYEDKETWRKYSLFYDNYKKAYWWIFVPTIVYMFAKGCIIAGGDGHGLFQSAGQLFVEAVMLILLLWTRPYETKSGQWINIAIQVVRVLSVACILVFVQELGMGQTTKTVTGVVLVAVQTTLTAVLAVLIAVNAIILFCRKNPHAQRQKEAENGNRDLDNLTPLDARHSLLADRKTHQHDLSEEMGMYNYPATFEPYRDVPVSSQKSRHVPTASTDRLVFTNDSSHVRSSSADSGPYSNSPERHPRLPNLDRPY